MAKNDIRWNLRKLSDTSTLRSRNCRNLSFLPGLTESSRQATNAGLPLSMSATRYWDVCKYEEQSFKRKQNHFHRNAWSHPSYLSRVQEFMRNVNHTHLKNICMWFSNKIRNEIQLKFEIMIKLKGILTLGCYKDISLFLVVPSLITK